MPQLMSMKDFLASGGAAVKAYKNKGVVPSYVAKDKTSRSRVGAGKTMKSQPMRMKKKRMMPAKKMGKGMQKK